MAAIPQVDVLIVGAGPYGLSIAAHAKSAGRSYACVGVPMESWHQMPDRMVLRSQIRDPNLSAPGRDLSLVSYLRSRGVDPDDYPIPPPTVDAWSELSIELAQQVSGSALTPAPATRSSRVWNPLPIQVFRDYGRWFIDQTQLHIIEDYVTEIENAPAGFVASLRTGGRLSARRVVIAVGQRSYRVIPDELATLPKERCRHTSEIWELTGLAGRRVLVVGGGQSALEWAVLMAEAGANVSVIDRGVPRQFGTLPYEAIHRWKVKTEDDLGWFRRLTPEERNAILRHPLVAPNDAWLLPRLRAAGVRHVPDDPWLLRSPASRRLAGAHLNEQGAITVQLQDGSALECDLVVCGTGYRVNLDRLPFLSAALHARIDRYDGPGLLAGYPVLNEHFESSVPGLHFAGYAAQGSFGNVLNFVDGVVACAHAIGRSLTVERTR